jgi:hypothetical protein
MRDDEVKEFAGWNSKDALLGVQHHPEFSQVIEHFLQVSNEVVFLFWHYRDIVDISVDVATNLVI